MPGADGAPFTFTGTGTETHEIALAEGRWTLTGQASVKSNCRRDPCPILPLTVQVDDGDPPRQDPYNRYRQDPYTAITLDIAQRPRNFGLEVSRGTTQLLWVGRLGYIKSGTQRLVVMAEPSVDWTLAFEDYDGPFPPSDPAGADGESFTIAGTGPAKREIRLAVGTWTMIMAVSNNFDCLGPRTCPPGNLFIGLETLGGGLGADFFDTASDWTGTHDDLRVADGLEWYYPTGPLVVTVDVEPQAKWTVTLVAPGAPMPTPTPLPTPTPTPTPPPDLATAWVRANFPCLTAAEIPFVRAFAIERFELENNVMVALYLITPGRVAGTVPITDAQRVVFDARIADLRTIGENLGDLSPPDTPRVQDLATAAEALGSSLIAYADAAETALDDGTLRSVAVVVDAWSELGWDRYAAMTAVGALCA